MSADPVSPMSVDSDDSSAPSQDVLIVRDDSRCLPLSQKLSTGDLVLLLTPAVPPLQRGSDGQTSDPFEPLGQALARLHPGIRHVPYTPRGGMTSTHVAFIRQAKVIVFVVSGPAGAGQYSQLQLSELVRNDKEDRPHVVVACCDPKELGPLERGVPTIIQIPGYLSAHLESAAETLFHDTFSRTISAPPAERKPLPSSRRKVDAWDVNRDQDAMYRLWAEEMGDQFSLGEAFFKHILIREGYHRHFVVRDDNEAVIAFCATYTHYQAKSEDALVGSLGLIIVQNRYQKQGIGKMLHDHAVKAFMDLQGVQKIKLGTTFPRLLYGIPVGSPAEVWFRERGWQMDETRAGTGQKVADWKLTFRDWKRLPSKSRLKFGVCKQDGFKDVTDFVDTVSLKHNDDNWYDLYTKLSLNLRDICVVVEEDRIIATAVLYNELSGTVQDELPWAREASRRSNADTFGGLACICIDGEAIRFPHYQSSQG
jgi:GNAT superfamily N-acetyltransferase